MEGDVLPKLHVNFFDVEIVETNINKVHELLDVVAFVSFEPNNFCKDLVAILFDSCDTDSRSNNGHSFEFMFTGHV